MFDFFSKNWQVLIGIIGSTITFFAGMKLKKARETKTGADAISAMQDAYARFVIQTNDRMHDMEEDLKHLKTKLDSVEKEKNTLKKQMRDLIRKNKQLMAENQKLKK